MNEIDVHNLGENDTCKHNCSNYRPKTSSPIYSSINDTFNENEELLKMFPAELLSPKKIVLYPAIIAIVIIILRYVFKF
jgi:hypothetical protein